MSLSQQIVEQETRERAKAVRRGVTVACGQIKESAHDLAMLAIQSDRYQYDHEFRLAVDRVLHLTQPSINAH